MANEIRYRAGTSAGFANLQPQAGTYYYLTDTGDLYFGSKKVTNDSDVEQLKTLLENLVNYVGEIPEDADSENLISYISESMYFPYDTRDNSKCLIIPNKAFFQCSLTNADFSNVLKIDEYAFAESMRLNIINFPSVLTIGERAFYDCISLVNINLPLLTNIDDYAFYLCSNLSSIDAKMLKRIGVGAFQETHISEIDLPQLETIGDYAFKNCTNLTSVSIPKVTEIGDSAFEGCTNLSSIGLLNVVSIKNNAFEDCSNLSSIYIHTPYVPSIGSNVFDDVSEDFKIYVNGYLLTLFKQKWSEYADIIYAIPGTETSSGNLPSVTASDSGKVMMVNEEGNWEPMVIENLVTWVEL